MATKDKNKGYQLVTEAIIAGLQAGKIAWRRPWSTLQPQNPVSGTVYKGINLLVLSLATFSDPRWMTFKQITDKGGKVKKGEKGTPIVFWSQVAYDDKDGNKRSFPLLKYFYVWNVEQCEGLELPELNITRDNEPIEACEKIVADMPNAPMIGHGGSRAFYRPSTDEVQMPLMSHFESADAYYGTLFHELAHSTGHADRLARPGITKATFFGTETYGREELVAELTAAFLCQNAGIDNDMQNTTAYLQGWLAAIKSDPEMITWAAGQASKAADYILCREYAKTKAEPSGNNQPSLA